MTLEGLDYSWSRPNVAQMKAAGVKFVVRYLDASRKGITKPELDALHAAGIAVVLVFESGAQWVLGGKSAGINAAKAARDLGTSIGAPVGTAIYFAVDFDVTSQMSTVEAGFDGVRSAIGSYRTGVYGEADVVDAVVGGGHAELGWDTYAWSGGRLSTHAVLYQYQNGLNLYGGSVDRDRALAADFGAWYPAGQGPSKTTTQQDDTEDLVAWMADNKAEVQAMLNATATSLHHDIMASVEHSLTTHGASQIAKVNASLEALYGWLARAEFDGKISEGHLPMSVKGARDDILTELRSLVDGLSDEIKAVAK